MRYDFFRGQILPAILLLAPLRFFGDAASLFITGIFGFRF